MILLQALDMISPGIYHLGHLAIVDADPAIEDTGHYFQ